MDKISILPEKKTTEKGAYSCNRCYDQGHNKAIDETALKLAKFLSGLEEELYNLVYGVFYLKDPFFAREDEAAQVAEIISKDITDHIKSKMGVSDVNS